MILTILNRTIVYYFRGCDVVVSMSEQHPKEHGLESYTVKMTKNYFPSVTQKEELLS